ncbi:hypothetical protein SAMN05428970_2679 [Agromyces sp. CF514]|uniref:hypothetical protein n=1 Tax=Agromyces sp. CF514 TaxID=1881031 RepID=UPI0008E09D11|nr:hypothetical protein [Agromyces sp. CF514]SFR82825.1 hypothetical protein SAMN05428970_2679 [Agromyces sp. CF514]
MRNARTTARVGAVCLGTAMLVGIAGVAAAEEQYGDGTVDIGVEIAELAEPGVLAMTVANTATTLTEHGSTATQRQFVGQLPTVTVTDTRTAEEIPAGAGWYVLGTSSDFVGDAGQPAIGAGHLGWAPHLIDGGDAGLVAEGDVVDTVMDEDDPDASAPFGLVDQELLALAIDSGAIAPEGQWSANADLFLRTPADVAPGGYTATMTLSLFE